MNSNQKKGHPQKTPGLHTIDIKHTELLNTFHKIETETIPNLIEEKENLKQKIKTLRKNQYDEYMDMRDRIKAIQQEIVRLTRQKKSIYWTIRNIFSITLNKRSKSRSIQTHLTKIPMFSIPSSKSRQQMRTAPTQLTTNTPSPSNPINIIGEM